MVSESGMGEKYSDVVGRDYERRCFLTTRPEQSAYLKKGGTIFITAINSHLNAHRT